FKGRIAVSKTVDGGSNPSTRAENHKDFYSCGFFLSFTLLLEKLIKTKSLNLNKVSKNTKKHQKIGCYNLVNWL
ncbi:MAG: hypothetical protein KBS98_00835, partial [Flavobacterium sp.]|nr:hypothetical protein [Candidatus Neoflavobacterium equi]